jgi:uncharacterized membrane protein
VAVTGAYHVAGNAAVLAARLNSVSFIFRETSKTGAGRAGNLDKSGAS